MHEVYPSENGCELILHDANSEAQYDSLAIGKIIGEKYFTTSSNEDKEYPILISCKGEHNRCFIFPIQVIPVLRQQGISEGRVPETNVKIHICSTAGAERMDCQYCNSGFELTPNIQKLVMIDLTIDTALIVFHEKCYEELLNRLQHIITENENKIVAQSL